MTKNLNVAFTERDWARVDRLKADLEDTTTTDVVKLSLKYLEYVVALKKSGGALQSRQADGQVTDLEFIRLMHLGPKGVP